MRQYQKNAIEWIFKKPTICVISVSVDVLMFPVPSPLSRSAEPPRAPPRCCWRPVPQRWTSPGWRGTAGRPPPGPRSSDMLQHNTAKHGRKLWAFWCWILIAGSPVAENSLSRFTFELQLAGRRAGGQALCLYCLNWIYVYTSHCTQYTLSAEIFGCQFRLDFIMVVRSVLLIFNWTFGSDSDAAIPTLVDNTKLYVTLLSVFQCLTRTTVLAPGFLPAGSGQ